MLNNKKIRYKGFSSRNFLKNGTSRLTDIELVKEDIFNHIFTRRGERVMMDYGTQIPDMTFEIMDDELIELLYDELTNVFNSDPRVKLLSLDVFPLYEQNTVVSTVSLKYVEFDITETFNLNIQFETVS